MHEGVAWLEEGPADGPLALCLHGFPDSAHTWRHLLPELAEAGFRAVAPWLRGYAPTAVPEDGRYDLAALAADANELHASLGGDERAVLIGHDWGAMAAYRASAAEPERWSKVVSMAVPPPEQLAGAFLSYEQLRRSWYIFFFQNPLAEAVVAMDDLAFVDRLWADWSPGYDATEDLKWAKESLRAPENLAAAIGYYRALFSAGGPSGRGPQPSLYLHGADDGCFGAEHAGPDAVVVEGAGHFLHLEQPAAVNARILEFLR